MTDRPTQKEIDTFEMPKPCEGENVIWYPTGNKNQRASVATVVRVYGRNVMLKSALGKVLDAVRHIDDPKLLLSESQREYGAWDFTEQHKSLDKLVSLVGRVSDLEERLKEVSALKRRVTMLEKQNAKSDEAPL